MKKLIINYQKINFLLDYDKMVEALGKIVEDKELYGLDFEERFNSQDGSYIICTGDEVQTQILLEEIEKL